MQSPYASFHHARIGGNGAAALPLLCICPDCRSLQCPRYLEPLINIRTAGSNNGQDDDSQVAPRLLNLGSHTFPVSTRNKLAQQYINQGLNLSYAFNHAEAGRAFREAARLDPSLAMAYWGQALVLGPNINATMEPEDEMPALELVQKAASLSAKASPRERRLSAPWKSAIRVTRSAQGER